MRFALKMRNVLSSIGRVLRKGMMFLMGKQEDLCVGESFLKESFPCLFRVCRSQGAKVSKCYQIIVIKEREFRHPLSERESI